MGAVTGQGLAGLIRESWDRLTFLAMAALFFINTGIAATEFAASRPRPRSFTSRYIVILATVVVFLLVLRASLKLVDARSSCSR